MEKEIALLVEEEKTRLIYQLKELTNNFLHLFFFDVNISGYDGEYMHVLSKIWMDSKPSDSCVSLLTTLNSLFLVLFITCRNNYQSDSLS
jgi:hypothetical protein